MRTHSYFAALMRMPFFNKGLTFCAIQALFKCFSVVRTSLGATSCFAGLKFFLRNLAAATTGAYIFCFDCHTLILSR